MGEPVIGLVLSGGAARGAYEVGVLLGISELLQGHEAEGPFFRVVAGTSVGAINGAWMAANAHVRDHNVGALADIWRGLQLEAHLRIDLRSLLGWSAPWRFLRQPKAGDLADRFGRSVLDPTALEGLVESAIDWRALHANVDSGTLRALVVPALHIGSGVTTLFTELAPGVSFTQGRHPRRLAERARITAAHVLASAAIPGLFPARRVGQGFFVDGGLRFNTPVSPAIRCGAERLLVISLGARPHPQAPTSGAGGATESYPSPVFLIGKLLNALLLDPVEHDLQVLRGFNEVMGVVDETLGPSERTRFDEAMRSLRGLSYRTIETLVFEPSQSISSLAGAHLREYGGKWQVGRFYDWLLSRAALDDATWEADLASYLMFDGSWTSRLIELGRADALARSGEVVAFFGH